MTEQEVEAKRILNFIGLKPLPERCPNGELRDSVEYDMLQVLPWLEQEDAKHYFTLKEMRFHESGDWLLLLIGLISDHIFERCGEDDWEDRTEELEMIKDAVPYIENMYRASLDYIINTPLT